MRYDGAYKTYKLYSVTEQDIAESGGSDTSRYVQNSVLVFLPDIEKPEIGTELIATDTMEAAQSFIDGKEKNPIKEVMDGAVSKSREQVANIQRNSLLVEDERRRKGEREQRAYYENNERE